MKAFFLKHQNLSIVISSVLLSMIIVLLSCSLASFIYPSISMQPYYNDPATFVIMGKSMMEGKIPYVDVFDHKGLYIFYITALYAYLGKFWIFFFMSFCISVSLIFFNLTLRELECNKQTIFVGSALFISVYIFFAQFPGDSDIILMLGMLMLYFYARGYKRSSDKDYLFACLLAGASAGTALNIRPSDAMLGFAFMVFYLVKRIKEKKIAVMLRDAGLCLLTLIIVALPAYIHAYSAHFLNEMVDAVFLSNFKYLGSSSDKSVVLVWMNRIIVASIFAGIFLLWFFKRKEYQLEESLFILITSGIIFLVQFVIALFTHYLISVLGFISLVTIVVVNKYNLLEKDKKTTKPISIIMLGIFCLSLLFNPVLYLSHISSDQADISYIKKVISEQDRKEHTFLFSVYPGLYLNADIDIIYPDFNAQLYHMKLSEEYSQENLSSFLQSNEVKFFVTRRELKETAEQLFGDANYVEVPTELDTVIVIYQHLIPLYN